MAVEEDSEVGDNRDRLGGGNRLRAHNLLNGGDGYEWKARR